ncbi:MAG TPA: nickel pincer cofactor biosynthesis protein LarB, partial [Tepidisphaeraceae bacterium]|nr:nickel pincer cofactor biosynthesis protein LarB [Tepidisphaeraceae bacterium]
MNEQSLSQLLTDVSTGQRGIAEAVELLKRLPFEQIDGFAKIDHHRTLRRNRPEAIYCEGKTPMQVAMIFERMAAHSPRVLATRASAAHHLETVQRVPRVKYDAISRCLWIDDAPTALSALQPMLVAAGTSDIPVAEESAIALSLCGYCVERIYDVGVAGLHRLLAHLPRLQAAPVLIVFAGMEGALPSVVAGLVAAPVIAVPTSVGYGASFGGLAA